MKQRLILLSVLASGLVFKASSQVAVYESPFDVPVDARGAGLGESLVALRANTSALMYNPAGLAGLKGMGLSYGERPFNWSSFTEGMVFSGVNAFAETPIGVFGAAYNRFSQGEFIITTSAGPDFGVGLERPYQYDIALGYGSRIAEGVEFGVAAKYYNWVQKIESPGGSPAAFSLPEITPAWLFDGGFLYTLPLSIFPGALEEELTFGVSVQNVGTKVKFHFSTESETNDQPLPEYFHAGLALTLHIPPADEHGHAPFGATLTAEYTNVLNYLPEGIGGSVYWGGGVELTLLEIVSLRGGFVINPYTNIYGEADRVAYRYGAGVNLPLERLGIPLPVVLSAEYSAIPLNDVGLGFLFGAQRHTLDVFSFGARLQ